MKKAIEVINKILEEELDVIAEGKRNIVAKRIVEELNLDRMLTLSLDDLPPKTSSFKPPVSE